MPPHINNNQEAEAAYLVVTAHLDLYSCICNVGSGLLYYSSFHVSESRIHAGKYFPRRIQLELDVGLRF